MIGPPMVLITPGHHGCPDISWDSGSLHRSGSDCTGTSLSSGQVLWHFIQDDMPSGITSGYLTAVYATAGTVGPLANYRLTAGGVMMWTVSTGLTRSRRSVPTCRASDYATSATSAQTFGRPTRR
jgi:hypothetical protein